MRYVLALFSLMTLAACVTEADRFSLYSTQQVCSSDAIAKKRYQATDRVNNWRRSISQVQNRTGTNVDRELASAFGLINRYEAEVEVGHDMIQQSCQLHSRCMEKNDYNQLLCAGSAEQYDRAQKRFAESIAYGRVVDTKVKEAVATARKADKEKQKTAKNEAAEDECRDGGCKPDCTGWDIYSSC